MNEKRRITTEPDFRDISKVAQIFLQLHNTTYDLDTLSKEAKRILESTAPEDEFMAIATWSGKCSLIHKLAPDKYPITADKKYKIPDLFAVFEYDGKSFPVLIEVKSRYNSQIPGPLRKAKFSPNYRQLLKNYGKLLGLPILVAQQIRPGDIWILVDIDTIGLDGKSTINMQYDLSSLLLGAFHVTFRKGTRFVLKVEKLVKKGEKQFTGVVREAYFETHSGEKIHKTKSPMMVLFDLGYPEEEQNDEEKYLTISYKIPKDSSFVNYQALYSAISWDKQLKTEKYPWNVMLKSGRYPISYFGPETIKEDEQFFKYILETEPKVRPEFLK
jgi:hypothetical protein